MAPSAALWRQLPRTAGALERRGWSRETLVVIASECNGPLSRLVAAAPRKARRGKPRTPRAAGALWWKTEGGCVKEKCAEAYRKPGDRSVHCRAVAAKPGAKWDYCLTQYQCRVSGRMEAKPEQCKLMQN